MSYRLQHVSIPRPPGNDDLTRAFYSDLLGLQEIPTPSTIEPSLDVIWFKISENAELHIFREEPQGDTSICHFCLVLDDVNALRRKLVAAGYSPWDEEPIPSRPRFFCRDPNSNIIEFSTIEADYLDFQES